jgi:hypothetical protein
MAQDVLVDQDPYEIGHLSSRRHEVAGVEKVGPDGRPIMIVDAVFRERGGPPEIISVKVPGAVPKLEEYARIRFVGLRAIYWTMGDRSGLSFRAESVAAVGAAK